MRDKNTPHGFIKGQKIRCINSSDYSLKEGEIYTFSGKQDNTSDYSNQCIGIDEYERGEPRFFHFRFEAVDEPMNLLLII